jgi:hypothetical protein
MKTENEIDEYFKRGLAEPDIPFDAEHWEKMEAMLNNRKPRRVVPLWLIAGGGIAAALLVALFIVLNQDPAVQPKDKGHAQNVAPMPAPSQDPVIAPEPVKHTSITATPARGTMLPAPIITTGPDTIVAAHTPVSVDKTPQQPVTQENPPVESIAAVTEPGSSSTGESPDKPLRTGGKPFVLSIIAAPDISSSPSNLSAKISTNIGVLGTYALSKKLSITTGLVYAVKRYGYGASTVGAYGTASISSEVYADCRVLDIPLNINYKVFQKGNNSVSVNTGISSYIMLNEQYEYSNAAGSGPAQISVREIVNKNQHFFGVANVSLSLNRQLSNKVSVGLQPFLKVPLTGIGEYNTRLRSMGVAVSLNMNLSKSTASGN